MTNPLRGEATLDLGDDGKFLLVLDHEALIAAEGVFGRPIELLMLAFRDGMAGAHRAMLWGALRRHHSDVTVERATELVLANRVKVIDVLTAAVIASMPEKAEGKKPGNRKARRAGKSSGSSGAKRA